MALKWLVLLFVVICSLYAVVGDQSHGDFGRVAALVRNLDEGTITYLLQKLENSSTSVHESIVENHLREDVEVGFEMEVRKWLILGKNRRIGTRSYIWKQVSGLKLKKNGQSELVQVNGGADATRRPAKKRRLSRNHDDMVDCRNGTVATATRLRLKEEEEVYSGKLEEAIGISWRLFVECWYKVHNAKSRKYTLFIDPFFSINGQTSSCSLRMDGIICLVLFQKSQSRLCHFQWESAENRTAIEVDFSLFTCADEKKENLKKYLLGIHTGRTDGLDHESNSMDEDNDEKVPNREVSVDHESNSMDEDNDEKVPNCEESVDHKINLMDEDNHQEVANRETSSQPDAKPSKLSVAYIINH